MLSLCFVQSSVSEPKTIHLEIKLDPTDTAEDEKEAVITIRKFFDALDGKVFTQGWSVYLLYFIFIALVL